MTLAPGKLIVVAPDGLRYDAASPAFIAPYFGYFWRQCYNRFGF